jgi:hypothetical protein
MKAAALMIEVGIQDCETELQACEHRVGESQSRQAGFSRRGRRSSLSTIGGRLELAASFWRCREDYLPWRFLYLSGVK